jgi:hypothetical protein
LGESLRAAGAPLGQDPSPTEPTFPLTLASAKSAGTIKTNQTLIIGHPGQNQHATQEV